eukprot:scaffold412_cov311-Pavlova_lutheri.AAC.13
MRGKRPGWMDGTKGRIEAHPPPRFKEGRGREGPPPPLPQPEMRGENQGQGKRTEPRWEFLLPWGGERDGAKGPLERDESANRECLDRRTGTWGRRSEVGGSWSKPKPPLPSENSHPRNPARKEENNTRPSHERPLRFRTGEPSTNGQDSASRSEVRGCNQQVGEQQKQARQPSAATLAAAKVCNDHRERHHNRRKRIKVQRKVVPDRPTHQNHERNHEDRDLNGRTDGHRNGQVHLVLDRHHHRRYVLACVPGNGKEDDADERTAQTRRFAEVFNRAGQELGAASHDDRDRCQRQQRGGKGKLRFVLFLLLRVVQMPVRMQLEEKVATIHGRKYDGRGPGYILHLYLFLCRIRIRKVVRGGRKCDGNAHEKQQSGGCFGGRLVKALRVVLDPTKEEATAQHQEHVAENGSEERHGHHIVQALFQGGQAQYHFYDERQGNECDEIEGECEGGTPTEVLRRKSKGQEDQQHVHERGRQHEVDRHHVLLAPAHRASHPWLMGSSSCFWFQLFGKRRHRLFQRVDESEGIADALGRVPEPIPGK